MLFANRPNLLQDKMAVISSQIMKDDRDLELLIGLIRNFRLQFDAPIL